MLSEKRRRERPPPSLPFPSPLPSFWFVKFGSRARHGILNTIHHLELLSCTIRWLEKREGFFRANPTYLFISIPELKSNRGCTTWTKKKNLRKNFMMARFIEQWDNLSREAVVLHLSWVICFSCPWLKLGLDNPLVPSNSMTSSLESDRVRPG